MSRIDSLLAHVGQFWPSGDHKMTKNDNDNDNDNDNEEVFIAK